MGKKLMNTLAETSPAELAVAATAFTWTGLQPGYALTTDNAALLLSYSGGLASAAVWVATDVGVWKRNQLRRLYAVGSDQYNEAIGNLYRELSEYMPLSDTTWRAYLNVGSAVTYTDRVEGIGPAVYIPAMSLSPDAFESYRLAVKEGTHKSLLAQLYGRRVDATRIAPTASSNGYGPHTDDAPFSASGPGVWADADEAVDEYEGQSSDSDLPVLSWATLADVRALVTAVLLERWTDAVDIAEKLETVMGKS